MPCECITTEENYTTHSLKTHASYFICLWPLLFWCLAFDIENHDQGIVDLEKSGLYPPPFFLSCFISFFFGKYKNYFLYRKNFKWQDNLVLTLLINYAIIIDNDISPRKKFLTIHQKYNWTLNALVCSFFPGPKEPNLSKIPTGQKTSPYGVCV